MYRSQLSLRALATIVVTALLAGCGGGGSSPSPTRFVPTPVSTATSGGGTTSSTAFTCSTSDTASGARRAAESLAVTATRRSVRRSGVSSKATGLIGVTYARALASSARSLAATREDAIGASLVREMTFPVTNRYERILRVTPGTEAQAIAALRTQAGVVSASMTGATRRLQTVSQRYFSNDPVYNGYTQTQLVAGGNTSSATYHVGPYEQSATTEGQWGDHAVRLDYAQEYSQANNGSGLPAAPGALGSSGVKIAVIDSGQDSTQPELSGKIPYQKCFITNGNVQSTSGSSVDADGHGTDVSGIALASSNNGVGFVGTGGFASLYAYRVFPTPDDTCVPPETNADSQCDANSMDISDAIKDAVATKNVNVINLSLGGGSCANGIDEDTTEQNAIESALAAKIIVVAASGNDNGDSKDTANTGAVSAPACINGVIAVGASALNDGQATGTASSPVGTATTPVEYVAGYSQYGSPAASVNSSNAWGIVAPGGDPSDADTTSDTTDRLHWIENIWTSTPYQANSTDTSFEGECTPDFGVASTIVDCRTLIAGTSQATPLVAGAVALILAANPNYQSPASMKQLLCSTAHDIGDAHEGCGRLDIYRAMATALGDPTLPTSQ